MRIQCPAKVNLFLEVTGKRPDGYHTLATLFAKIHLYDVLELEADPSGRMQLCVESDHPGIPAGPENLVWRAAEAFRRSFRVRQGVRMKLIKRIPAGAGLGGGSSDAAGALLGMARLFDLARGAAGRLKLRKLGAKLGADVPFFLHPAAFCLGRGIGDRLTPVPVPKSLPFMILAYPGVGVPTVQSYARLARPPRSVVLTRLSQLDKLLSCLRRGRPIREWEGHLFNRLEESNLPVLEQVAQARRILERLGLRGVRMTGSGSGVFGFAASHADGERVLERLRGYPWRTYLTSCNG